MESARYTTVEPSEVAHDTMRRLAPAVQALAVSDGSRRGFSIAPEDGMKAILLSSKRGKKYRGVVIVDDEDYEWACQWAWCWGLRGTKHNREYAIRSDALRGLVYMHRDILNAPYYLWVDHANGNGLDNRRTNLRICTPAQNIAGKNVYQKATSMYRGVHYDKKGECYQAQVACRGKRITVGCYDNEEEAARAYDARAREEYGQFARLNFPENNNDRNN